jgi:general secretion pathway protein J
MKTNTFLHFYNLENGMTLLEILIAMVVFTIIAAAGYGGLHQGLAVQQQLQEQQTWWKNLDAVVNLIEQDLDQVRNIAPRTPVTDALAFRGYSDNNSGSSGEFIKFTRGGYQTFQATNVGPYLRLAYRLRDGVLYRVSWRGLNLPENEPGEESKLLTDIKDVSVRYLHETRRWVDTWPLRFTGEEAATVPRAVELSISLTNNTTYRRVFYVGPLR